MARVKSTDVTFAEATGLESNQHAKALAKAQSAKKKQKYQTYYTSKGTKIVKFTVKPTGVYNEYVGNISKKKEAQQLKDAIAMWKKESLWVEPHMVEEFCSNKIAELTK